MIQLVKNRSKRVSLFAVSVLIVTFLALFGCGSSGGGGGDDAQNIAPTAEAGDPQAVNEGDTVNLTGVGTDSDGTIVSYSWAQTSPASPTVSLTGADTSTPSFTAPPVAAAGTPFTFELTVADNDAATGTDQVTITVNVASNIYVSQEVPPQIVNLTGEGSSDWAHWGLTVVGDVNRSLTGGTQIGDYTEVGANNGIFRIGTDVPYAFAWGDGTPTLTETGINRGIFFAFTGPVDTQEGNGFSLQVGATTTPKTLRLYIGAFNATGKLVAQFEDGTATSSDVFLVNPPGELTSEWLIKVVTITFRAETSTNLTVSYTLDEDHASGSGSAIGLFAATLVDGPAVTAAISPAGGDFNSSVNMTLTATPSDADIYYTTDGTDPDTTNGTLFTGSPVPISALGDTTVKAKAFRVDYADSAIVEKVFTINAGSGGNLSAHVESSPLNIVDLTVEGSMDWRHWARDNSGSQYSSQKDISPDPNLISTWTELGTSSGKNQIGKAIPFGFDWSDGVVGGNSYLSGTNIRTGQTIFYNSDPGAGAGYQLTVDVPDTAVRTLELYVGVVDGTGKIAANLDAGADPVEVLVDNDTTVGVYNVVTIDFQGTPSTTTLTVDFTLETHNGATSHLQLIAATLY